MNKNVKITYKYFEVCCYDNNNNECNYDLREWIKLVTTLSLEETIKDIGGITGRIENETLLDDNFYVLNFMRLEALSNTYKVKESEKAEHIDLDDDEYIGKNTVLLYDPDLNIAMIQCNRGSFGVFGIESYINSFNAELKCFFKPILNNFALNNCYKYPTKKIDIRFSNISGFVAKNSKSFKRIIDEMKQLNGVSAHIEISTGRKRKNRDVQNGLDPETVFEISNDIKNGSHAISSAKLTINEDGKSHIIDLIENIECEYITFKIPERGELSYKYMASKMLQKYREGVRTRIRNVIEAR